MPTIVSQDRLDSVLNGKRLLLLDRDPLYTPQSLAFSLRSASPASPPPVVVP